MINLVKLFSRLLKLESSFVIRNFSIMANWQQEKEKYLSMNLDEKRKHYKCGSNNVKLSDIDTWQMYGQSEKIAHKFSGGDFTFKSEINKRVSIYIGDITALEIDAIVNAANAQLAGGGGVDGAIHNAADYTLLQAECRTLGGCETGNSKITGGYKLPAKYVIHTVGPVGEKPGLLQGCYKTSLELLEQNKLKSVAFPCVSTGIYHYPNENAAHVALETVRKWFDSNPYSKQIDRVIFCLFMPDDVEYYHKLMPHYFPLQ